MTITQAAFALFLLCCIPGFGVCGGLVCEFTRLRWFGGLAVGALGGFVGLCTSAVLAGARHPRYPLEGPPEHTALLYLIPAFVVGVGVVAGLERYGRTRQREDADAATVAANLRRGKLLLRGGVSLAVVLILGTYSLFVWPFHRALPWGATQVREETWTEGFLPDYTYTLKARISEDEFRSYVEALELTPYVAEGGVEGGASDVGGPEWWDPPPCAEGTTYVYSRGTEQLVARYGDGWLYVSGSLH